MLLTLPSKFKDTAITLSVDQLHVEQLGSNGLGGLWKLETSCESQSDVIGSV